VYLERSERIILHPRKSLIGRLLSRFGGVSRFGGDNLRISPYKSPLLSRFGGDKLSTILVYFLERIFKGIEEYSVNTKSPPIPTSLGGKNTREVNKDSRKY
jgi:hypothetical protein